MKHHRLLILAFFALPVLVQPVLADDWQTVLSQAQSDLAAGNLDSAESGFRQAESLLEAAKTSGKDELQRNGLCLVDCLVGISKVKERRGESADSEQVYEMGLNTLQKLVEGGWKSHKYADYLPAIADLYDKHGKTDQADLAWQKIIEIRTTVAPTDDSARLIAAYSGYAKFLRAHNRPEEAVPYENKVAQIKYSQQ
jgi:tetratricopeptide (TPR) repeat protein